MKIRSFCDYDQVQNNICHVFNALESPYGEAHGAYDQTHGSYGQAHAQQRPRNAHKHLTYIALPNQHGLHPSFYMEWFMVWIIITKDSTGKHPASTFGWFGMCLPIKTAVPHGLHRKVLEQNAPLMLQKQWMPFLF